jgi:hypothetical protein
MRKKGWGSSTGQGRLNLVKGRDVISILKTKNAMRNGSFMDEAVYLEGYYEDPIANQPAVRGERELC